MKDNSKTNQRYPVKPYIAVIVFNKATSSSEVDYSVLLAKNESDALYKLLTESSKSIYLRSQGYSVGTESAQEITREKLNELASN